MIAQRDNGKFTPEKISRDQPGVHSGAWLQVRDLAIKSQSTKHI